MQEVPGLGEGRGAVEGGRAVVVVRVAVRDHHGVDGGGGHGAGAQGGQQVGRVAVLDSAGPGIDQDAVLAGVDEQGLGAKHDVRGIDLVFGQPLGAFFGGRVRKEHVGMHHEVADIEHGAAKTVQRESVVHSSPPFEVNRAIQTQRTCRVGTGALSSDGVIGRTAVVNPCLRVLAVEHPGVGDGIGVWMTKGVLKTSKC